MTPIERAASLPQLRGFHWWRLRSDESHPLVYASSATAAATKLNWLARHTAGVNPLAATDFVNVDCLVREALGKGDTGKPR